MVNQKASSPYASDAEWYFEQSKASREFYNVFFDMCHKFGVSWSKATSSEKAFITEITRFTLERNAAKRMGQSVDSVKPVFTVV